MPTGPAGARGVAVVRALALLLLAGAAGLVAWQLIDHYEPGATTVSALLAGAIGVLGLVYPTGFLALGSRISHVDAFGIELELQATEGRLEMATISRFVPEEDGVTRKPPTWPSSTGKAIRMLQAELREKLAFCTDAMLDDESDIAPEYKVENLARKGLLNADAARLSIDILYFSGQSLGKLDAGEREDFLDRTWAFTSRFASRAFDAQARRALRAGHWEVADFTQRRGHRRDFHRGAARDPGTGRGARGGPRKPVLKTADRLARAEFPLPELHRIVVVPDHVDHLWKELDDGPVRVNAEVLVMRLHHLAELKPTEIDLDKAPLAGELP